MTGPGRVRVGVVGGTRLPGNVRTLLSNVQRLLADHPIAFDLDLLVSDGVDAPAGYDRIDPGFGAPGRAIDTLRALIDGIIAYVEDHPVDVLFQVTKFPLHGCATATAARRTGTPVLTRFAGDNFNEFRFSSGLAALKAFGLNNVFGRAPVHWSDRIIVLGPYGRSEIERRNDEVPVVEIPQPVDRDQFTPVPARRERELARELGFPASERALLTVGRLTERKGMGTLVETAQRLSDRGEPFRWYVLGEGPMRATLADTPGVEPLGRVDFERMVDYYRAADLVVHTSLIEGLPNVLLEAAACGTPTVARDVGDSALVASTTFADDDALPELVSADHEPVTLGEQFAAETLREKYVDALLATARRA